MVNYMIITHYGKVQLQKTKYQTRLYQLMLDSMLLLQTADLHCTNKITDNITGEQA
jgi:hypothetical protein